MDINVIKKYINIEIDLFLDNKFKYSGHILEIFENSIIFLDKFNNSIAIDIDTISIINPIKKNKGDF